MRNPMPGMVSNRGRDVLVQQRIGLATGDELVPYLAWRDIPASAARRVGLLLADGRERLLGRIVFPENRQHQPKWLIGRIVESAADLPCYLGSQATARWASRQPRPTRRLRRRGAARFADIAAVRRPRFGPLRDWLQPRDPIAAGPVGASVRGAGLGRSRPGGNDASHQRHSGPA
jgi:hypothetical protein